MNLYRRMPNAVPLILFFAVILVVTNGCAEKHRQAASEKNVVTARGYLAEYAANLTDSADMANQLVEDIDAGNVATVEAEIELYDDAEPLILEHAANEDAEEVVDGITRGYFIRQWLDLWGKSLERYR